MGEQLHVATTPIPGLLVVSLPLHSDQRGWFKENWQREKMLALGLPDFGPVQNNISFNSAVGTTRGIHAEPWDKFVSVAGGRIFGAWVDLRSGPTFGTSFSCELGPDKAVFVPTGVGNGYQTLEEDTAYVYLVNAHWSERARYTFLNLADTTVRIPWPIPLERATLSEKDRSHPSLKDVMPSPPRKTLVLGGEGQLGRELSRILPHADVFSRGELDIRSPELAHACDWAGYGTVINAAAYTRVDEAETPEGRISAWATNAVATATLARICRKHRITLVHVSTDYVFDGSRDVHTEEEPLSPLGVYGQSKAAGDLVVGSLEAHYLIRTSWVVGDGKNFVATMAELAAKGASPSVVSDQVGRLTFTPDLAKGIVHLLTSQCPYGTYNLSNEGPPSTWVEIAQRVFTLSARSASDVVPATTSEYFGDRPHAPRPASSILDLSKIEATGFTPRDMDTALTEYLDSLRT